MTSPTLLDLPTGCVRAVLDTDAYNEIDDQFAIVYSVLAPDRIDLEAVYAAPFLNKRSTSAADGMEKSYEEIERVLGLLGAVERIPAFRGAEAFLQDSPEPVVTPAVEDLIARARDREKGPLYVMAIGAITNVATALLLAPDIAENVVVIWLGGHAEYWADNHEFNFIQDVVAVRAVLESEATLFRVPCVPVADHLMTTPFEMEHYLKGKGDLADYLWSIFRDYREHDGAWAKVIWDIAVVGWLVDPSWVPSEVAPLAILSEESTWAPCPTGRKVRTALQVHRDPI
ncbi:MAG: nucleoside hydrolase, partial [Puniceicoccales bacterium]